MEVRESFRSFERWSAWSTKVADDAAIRRAVVASATAHGFFEPITNIRRRPHEVTITHGNLHESISSHFLNSRKRALLAQIDLEFRTRRWSNRRDLKILAAESLSRLALILRGIYPYFLGTEYLPDAESRAERFPIPHLDLQEIGYADSLFDVFVAGDVFEHVPDLDRAIREILRVLKPGGLIISSFPFSPSRRITEIKASIGPDGQIINHKEPEYHGNPVDPAGGSLVFQYPGWDLLEKLGRWGCSDAYYSILVSSRFGITSDAAPGPFILTAQKAGGEGSATRAPSSLMVRKEMPERLISLLALPRSGTTILTSMFSVHSEVVASFEPWNSKVLKVGDPAEATISTLAEREKLPPLAGKTLFVKETGADQAYIQAMQQLLRQAPYTVERHALMLLRDPFHTLLSEVERRNEWWGANLELNTELVANFAKNRGAALWHIIELARGANGLAISFEQLAANAERLMRELLARLGLCFEREQLEYEKHLRTKQVRGDMNVSKDPSPLELARATSREDKVAALQDMIAKTPAAPWFDAYQSLHRHITEAGGILRLADLPASMTASLRPAS